jgi:membrane protease YdiL (CAAX protease family)
MRCPHCGSALGPAAAWCGLCHAAVTAPAAVPAAAAAPAYAPPEYPAPEYPAPEFSASAARAALAGGSVPVSPYAPPHNAWPAPMPAPPVRPATTKAGRTVVAAIAIGALSQGVMWLLTRNSVENEAAIRYALCTTLAVYAIVAVIVIRRLAASTEPLHWRGSWHPAASVALGLAMGGGLAYTLMSGVHSAGRQGGDPRVALLVSEGDLPHILATVLITVIAAPVLEELLFRGLLLAQLAPHGRRLAIWVSAFAFAAWHLSPSGLVYYTLMGSLMGAVFIRRGLYASMALHAAFNGVLTIAAISYALAPGAVARTGALTVRAPHGWHAVAGGFDVHLTGPSAAEILAVDAPLPGATRDADLIADRLRHGAVPGAAVFQPRLETVRTISLRAGDAAAVSVTVDGRDGEMVLLPHRDGVYLVVLVSGGSPRVRADFARVLKDLTVGTQAGR